MIRKIFDGNKMFRHADVEKYAPDGKHPNAAGIDLKAKRIDRLVMPTLLQRIDQ